MTSLTFLLSILAIALAGVALVPYGFEIYFYLTKKPRFEIKITSKTVSKRGKEKIFDFWLGVRPENVSVLINRVILSLPFDIRPEKYPSSTRPVQIIMPIEDTEFGPSLILEQGEVAYHPKSGKIYLIRLVSDKKIDFIKTTLTIESEVDVLKLGFWSIFYRTRKYRNQKALNIRLDTKRQKLQI